MKRIIFHIDVNNAFLSWTAIKMLNEGSEVDIRKIPSVIGGDESSRHGIVLAKSPIAKKMGIKTAMSLYEARKICPDIKVFKSDYKWYQEESKKLMEYLSTFSPSLEQFSIDECFLDLTGTNYLYKDYIELANTIKDNIKKNFGFTVNIGIANNKLCAKMASDFEKPDKVHTLFEDEIVKKLWPLPVGDIFMVGKSTTERLNKMGIKTVNDLAHTDIKKLEKAFKNQSTALHNAAWGIDESPVESERRQRKSISTEATLPNDENDREKLKEILFSQSIEVGRQLRNKKMFAKTVGIIYKDFKFKKSSNQITLDNPINEDQEIYKIVKELFDSTYDDEYIRLIGVKLSNLATSSDIQLSIFDQPEETNNIQDTIDEINNKFGRNVVKPASLKIKTTDRK
jgi:DNA polymerase-4